MTMYYAGDVTSEVAETIFEIQRKFMGDHRPASTAVGVQSLALGCLFEMSVSAAIYSS